jgi:hypothetical protein
MPAAPSDKIGKTRKSQRTWFVRRKTQRLLFRWSWIPRFSLRITMCRFPRTSRLDCWRDSRRNNRSQWRRNALIGGLVTVTSVAAALLLAFAQWNETGEPDVDSLVAKVISVRSGAWQNTTPPIPCTAHLRYNVNLLGWMSVKLNGVQVTVFKVSIAGKKPAYVASYAGEAGSRSFPNQPHIGTQDYRYGVSHNDGMTHVLIVHGGEDDYRQFARTSNGTA